MASAIMSSSNYLVSVVLHAHSDDRSEVSIYNASVIVIYYKIESF